MLFAVQRCDAAIQRRLKPQAQGRSHGAEQKFPSGWIYRGKWDLTPCSPDPLNGNSSVLSPCCTQWTDTDNCSTSGNKLHLPAGTHETTVFFGPGFSGPSFVQAGNESHHPFLGMGFSVIAPRLTWEVTHLVEIPWAIKGWIIQESLPHLTAEFWW